MILIGDSAIEATNATATTNMVYNLQDLYIALIIIAIFALFVGVIYLYEIKRAYDLVKGRKTDDVVNALIRSVQDLTEKVKGQPTITTSDITQLSTVIDSLKDLTQATGISGFTRGQISMTVIFILGIAVILVLFAFQADTAIVSNVVSMLGATLAAVVGFYFGEKGSSQGK